ncbi:MAG: class I SAM-dependent methyltransferase [Myxococcota bacterium]
MSSLVVVRALRAEDRVVAAALAAELGLPLLDEPGPVGGHLELVLSSTGWGLQAGGDRRGRPIVVDLVDGDVGRRRREPGRYRSELARAVGVTRDRAPRVIDATAGLGVDSAVLAWLGCSVVAVEREPVLAVLWHQAMRQLTLRSDAPQLVFVSGRAEEVLSARRATDGPPDVIYLDPMFPPRSKTALVRKEMQLLQRLSSHPDDTERDALFAQAMSCARGRVVVKRPRTAPPLAPGVSFSLEGKTTRFDVYLTRQAEDSA